MHSSTRRLLTLAVSCGLLCAGCSGIDPTPFQAFHQATENLRDSVGTVETTVVDETRTRELAAIAADPQRFSELEIQFGDPSYEWSYTEDPNDPLVFVALENRAQAAGHLNEMFAAYAGLLADLATFRVTGDEIDQQAQNIEGEAQKVLGTLGKGSAVSAETTAEVNFLSNVFVTAVQAYAQRKQKRTLERVLESQQPTVEQFAKMGESLMADSANDLADEYQRAFQGIRRQVAAAADAATRGPLVQQAMTLNDALTKELDTVRQLHATYAGLPAAHAQLAQGVRDGRGVSRGAALSEFVNRAARLEVLYQKLADPDTTTTQE